jgi:hypothetical protein
LRVHRLRQRSTFVRLPLLPLLVVVTAAAIALEVYLWRQRAAPKTLSKALPDAVRQLLHLADRITAVQVAVAGLDTAVAHAAAPDAAAFSFIGSSNTGCLQPTAAAAGSSPFAAVAAVPGRRSVQAASASPAPAPAGDDNHSAQAQQRAAEAAADARAALAHVAGVLAAPLHAAHAEQLALVAAVAGAVSEHLLQPSDEAQAALAALVPELEASRRASAAFVAELRRQVHADVMSACAEPGADEPAGAADAHTVCSQPHASASASPVVSAQLVRLGTLGVIATQLEEEDPDAVDGSRAGSGARGAAFDASAPIGQQGDVRRWWWMLGGESYAQLLAFQWAWDAAMAEVAQVAAAVLALRGRR